MLGNTNPDPFAQALHEADGIVAQYGYGKVRVDVTGSTFVASAIKVVGTNQYMAQAIGRTPRYAAEQLVRTITRR